MHYQTRHLYSLLGPKKILDHHYFTLIRIEETAWNIANSLFFSITFSPVVIWNQEHLIKLEGSADWKEYLAKEFRNLEG